MLGNGCLSLDDTPQLQPGEQAVLFLCQVYTCRRVSVEEFKINQWSSWLSKGNVRAWINTFTKERKEYDMRPSLTMYRQNC